MLISDMAKKAQKYVDYRYLIRRAVLAGKLEKPDFCSACGNRGKINAHHNNYTKPFEIMWLCNKCHLGLHAQLNGHKPRKPVKKPYDPDNRKTVNINGRLYVLKHLKKEPFQAKGLFLETIIDERKYFTKEVNLKEALESLTFRERKIIKLRYGFEKGHIGTFKEIGKVLKVPKQTIHAIEKRAIRKLQRLFKETA